MKKGISVFFCFLSLVLILGAITTPRKNKIKIAYADYAGEIQSESAYLIDEKTDKVLYSKNETKKMPIASMCKIMTLLVCYDNVAMGNISLNDIVIASENASSMGGSQVFLENNGEYKVGELLKAITIASANDACVAMAEQICGSQQQFVNKMNEKASELGLDNTYFVNCTGLPQEGQYSCAKDVAKMFKSLIKYEQYFDYSKIWMDKIEHPNNRVTEISNTNKLIKFYNGCDGGKTGYTSEAGHCLCATAKKGDTRLISVVIKAPNSKKRFNEVSNLFNYGFENYTTKEIIKEGECLDATVTINNSKIKSPKLTVLNSIYDTLKKGESVAYDYNYSIKNNLKAPLKRGDVVGEITIYSNNVEIANTKIILLEDLPKNSYFDCIKDVVIKWNLI